MIKQLNNTQSKRNAPRTKVLIFYDFSCRIYLGSKFMILYILSSTRYHFTSKIHASSCQRAPTKGGVHTIQVRLSGVPAAIYRWSMGSIHNHCYDKLRGHVMKNWLPLVFGPVFTIDKQPEKCKFAALKIINGRSINQQNSKII